MNLADSILAISRDAISLLAVSLPPGGKRNLNIAREVIESDQSR
jgi:hypothetical protein